MIFHYKKIYKKRIFAALSRSCGCSSLLISALLISGLFLSLERVAGLHLLGLQLLICLELESINSLAAARSSSFCCLKWSDNPWYNASLSFRL